MRIYLGYIEGISRIDTPYFADISEQETYFDSHEVVSIENTFYPPHYTNAIKIDSEDVNFDSNVNYLWFVYLGKVYYYFIDEIEYVSESVAYLYITMDTIQTYMFNISVSNGIIERKFIDRWVQNNGIWEINRNYIRENVSEGIFYPIYLQPLNNNIYDWCFIVKLTSILPIGDSTSTKNSGTVICYDKNPTTYASADGIPTPLVFGIVPFHSNKSYKENHTVPTSNNQFPSEILTRITQKDYCYDIVAFPFMPVIGIDINTYDGTWILKENPVDNTKNYFDFYEYDNPNDAGGHNYRVILSALKVDVHMPSGQPIDTSHYVLMARSYTGQIYEVFSRNMLKNKPFNYEYLPILLDNNYNRTVFGSNYANTTFPLEKLKLPVCYYKYYANIESNSIVYMLDKDNSYNDVYRTTVIDNKVIGVTLKNSPWETYVSQNRSRWIGAAANTALDIIVGASHVGSAEKIGRIGTSRISNTDVKWGQLRQKNGKFSRKRKFGSSTTSLSNAVFGKVPNEPNYEDLNDAVIGGIGGMIGQGLKDINKFCEPSKVTNQGDLSPLITKDYQIYYKQERVQDYDYCANFFHRNGYLVNEHVNLHNFIFGYVNTRFYFNVLKMNDVDLHLHNVIEDTNTLENIKDRLYQGLRLWNINPWTSKYQLTVSITELSPFINFSVGDDITLSFETTSTPTVHGRIIDVTYDPGVTQLPLLITIETDTKVEIGAATNYSQGSYNGQVFQFDYDNTSWQDPVTHYMRIGDFQYDNVEKAYLD